jgi:hypothetical protein
VKHDQRPAAVAVTVVAALRGKLADEAPPAVGAVTSVIASGVVSLVVGATAGLIVPGSARLILWFSVTGITAAAAGAVYDTGPIRACCRVLAHWLGRIGI